MPWEKFTTLSAFSLATLLPTPAAHANDWNAALTVASDKVQRGLSQTYGHSFSALDLSINTDTGWNAALGWAQPVYLAQGGRGELSLALAKSWQLDNDWVMQLAATRYDYTGTRRARDFSYSEAKFSAGWQGRLFATITVLPNAPVQTSGEGVRHGRAVAVDLAAQERLAGRLVLELGVGYNDLQAQQGTGYAYGSVGLRYGVGPLQVQLCWIDSQAVQRGLAVAALAGQRRVASLIWAF